MINEPKLHVADEGFRNVAQNYEEYKSFHEGFSNIWKSDEEVKEIIKKTFKGDISDKLFKELYVTYKIYGISEFYRKIEEIIEK